MKDLGDMFKKAQELQEKLDEFQKELETLEVLGQSGGGLVTVTLNGKGVMRRVSIDPSLLVPEEAEVLEDLLVAAHNDAKNKVEQRAAEQAQKMTGGMGLPPGFKLPF
jgi:DNA-binding YbaB/EbfC family protein